MIGLQGFDRAVVNAGVFRIVRLIAESGFADLHVIRKWLRIDRSIKDADVMEFHNRDLPRCGGPVNCGRQVDRSFRLEHRPESP